MPSLSICKVNEVTCLISTLVLVIIYFSAASPPATYNTSEMARYVIIPTPESSRRISLSCAIRPGALTDRYSVTWEQILPHESPHPLPTITQSITVQVNSTSFAMYRYTVRIQHSSDVSVSYSPPPVTIHWRGERNNIRVCYIY